MFCSHCGKEIGDKSNYCYICGAKAANIHETSATDNSMTCNIMTASIPRNEQNKQAQPIVSKSTVAPAIWNPNATVNWSVLFTPIFGSYLQMLNWKLLGEESAALSSKRWLYVSVGILMIELILYALLPDNSKVGSSILYLINWNVASGRKQMIDVK
jgi:hypothetical protein